MMTYDGIYRLRATPWTAAPHEPSACAWRVRIINLALSRPQVDHLRQFVVFAVPAGYGVFQSSCANSIGRGICRDFCLDVQRVIWIEHFPKGNHRLSVAVFQPASRSDSESYYNIDWRPIRAHEIEMLRRFIAEVDELL